MIFETKKKENPGKKREREKKNQRNESSCNPHCTVM